MLNKKLITSAIFAMAVSVSGQALASGVDKNLPDYKKTSGVSGNLSSVCSETLANLMASDSSTAPPSLTEGTSNMGPMSRKMKSKEMEAFEKRHGYKPTAVPVAIDALAVYVNRDNPIKGMTIKDVDAVFSSTRKCGASKDITKWGDLGLSGAWKNRDIQLYGRNSVSGTYGYFKKKALCKGDFKSNVNEQPGSASVVQSVTASLNGIGYSGIGYKTSGVKAVPISNKGGEYIDATPENAVKGNYPLARFLYVYVNKHPNKPLQPLEREFIKMVLSRTGQLVVVKDGYIPMPAKFAEKALTALQ